MRKRARSLKSLQEGLVEYIEEQGAEIRNSRMLSAPPQGFWIYFQYGGKRFKMQLESLDDLYAA
ncbi:MAG: hypothetical protein QNJ94_07460 [Alphaproteobacteria bacterium]|nr:hypothetical protein [Alphaproteobacteria bacterium]